MRMANCAIAVIVVMLLAVGVASAALTLPLNPTDEITIYDGQSSASKLWWSAREDDEVEPGCVARQKWDLEGFFLDGTELYVAGAFNFDDVTGDQTLGDIFIDITGDAGMAVGGPYPKATTVNDRFGYEYVLHQNMGTKKYDIYELGDDTWTKTVGVSINGDSNPSSNPWVWDHGVTEVVATGLDFQYEENLTSAQVAGFSGASHSVACFDLTALLNDAGEDVSFTAHVTLKCGNDNLMGSADASHRLPDAGATVALLGLALIGLAGARKRF